MYVDCKMMTPIESFHQSFSMFFIPYLDCMKYYYDVKTTNIAYKCINSCLDVREKKKSQDRLITFEGWLYLSSKQK